MSPRKRLKIESAASTTIVIIDKKVTWIDTGIAHAEMKPSATLCIGQCFNWHPIGSTLWVGVLNGRAVAIRETDKSSEYAFLGEKSQIKQESQVSLNEYFQTSESLTDLYSQWQVACSRMTVITQALPGVRVVRQEPFECLVSFILSSNNNIRRITQLLQTIRSRYGVYLCTIMHQQIDQQTHIAISHCADQSDISFDTSTFTKIDLYSFPTLEALAAVSEEEFKSIGLGYRAKFLRETTQLLTAKTLSWLYDLRNQPRDVVQRELMTLSGIGPKVADCIALFSLDQRDVIPVDTHVWDIATRDYNAQLQQKSLTPAVYATVGDIFRTRFGSRAGWAHSVLFAAELPQFTALLPEPLQIQMRHYKEIKKEQGKNRKRKENNVE